MQITPMSGPFGAIARDVDLAADQSEATMRALIAALHEHQVLAIPGQSLDYDQYAAFGRFWGKPLLFLNEKDRKQEHPELIRIANPPSTPQRFRDGARFWHQDSSYEDVPASVTMLYGIETPREHGETLIASARLAYDALDAETKDRIENLVGLHCLGGSPALPGENIPCNAEAIARYGLTSHPLVLRHPVTGRKALYLSGSAYGVEGMNPEEGRELVGRLRAHCTLPRFVNTYKVETGDIFLWDNFQVLHSATPIEYSDEPGKRRLLYRISTKGIPALCAAEAAA